MKRITDNLPLIILWLAVTASMVGTELRHQRERDAGMEDYYQTRRIISRHYKDALVRRYGPGVVDSAWVSKKVLSWAEGAR